MENKNWTDSDKRTWTHWFEIPTSDFDRAKEFYEATFKMEIEATDFGGFKMGIFPHRKWAVPFVMVMIINQAIKAPQFTLMQTRI